MQQVNLFQPELLPKRDMLSFSSSVTYFCILAAVLAFFAYWDWQQYSEVKTQVSNIELRVAELKKLNETMREKPPLAVKAQLETEIVRLQSDVAGNQLVLSLLKSQLASETYGFAVPLIKLRQALPETLNLTSFVIDFEHHAMHISGVSKNAEDVAKLLDTLIKQEQFADFAFGPLAIQKQSNHYTFFVGPANHSFEGNQ